MTRVVTMTLTTAAPSTLCFGCMARLPSEGMGPARHLEVIPTAIEAITAMPDEIKGTDANLTVTKQP